MPTPQNKPVSDLVSFMKVLQDLEPGDSQKFIFDNNEFLIVKIK